MMTDRYGGTAAVIALTNWESCGKIRSVGHSENCIIIHVINILKPHDFFFLNITNNFCMSFCIRLYFVTFVT